MKARLTFHFTQFGAFLLSLFLFNTLSQSRLAFGQNIDNLWLTEAQSAETENLPLPVQAPTETQDSRSTSPLSEKLPTIPLSH